MTRQQNSICIFKIQQNIPCTSDNCKKLSQDSLLSFQKLRTHRYQEFLTQCIKDKNFIIRWYVLDKYFIVNVIHAKSVLAAGKKKWVTTACRNCLQTSVYHNEVQRLLFCFFYEAKNFSTNMKSLINKENDIIKKENKQGKRYMLYVNS